MSRRGSLGAAIACSLALAACGITTPWWTKSSKPERRFSVSPSTLSFMAPVGGSIPPAQHVVLFNEGTGFDVLMQPTPPVYSVSPNPVTPVAGEGFGYDVEVAPPSQLGVGTFTGELKFVPCTTGCTAALTDPPPLVVTITYIVTP